MNEFATSSEPGGTNRPAPPVRALPDELTVVSAYRAAVRFAKGISGLDAYDRYVRHREAHHPDEPLLEEADFWRCRWEADEKNPKARCC